MSKGAREVNGALGAGEPIQSGLSAVYRGLMRASSVLVVLGGAVFALVFAASAMLWIQGGELGLGLFAAILFPIGLIGLAVLAVGIVVRFVFSRRSGDPE